MAVENNQISFAYWAIRGLGQVPRLLLEYSGANWKDVQIKDHDKWFGDLKPSLGLPLPNLPYLIDGDFKLTESSAICQYISEKFGLAGDDIQERATVAMAVSFIRDGKSRWTRMCYSPDFDQLKEGWVKDFPAILERLTKFLGENEWLVGNQVTWADFELYELLWANRKMDEEVLGNFPTLQAHLDRFEKLPKIEEYLKSEQYVQGPINAQPWAKFW